MCSIESIVEILRNKIVTVCIVNATEEKETESERGREREREKHQLKNTQSSSRKTLRNKQGRQKFML